MNSADIESGTLAATEISKKILELVKQGADPAAIAIATTGIGLAMLMEHYGQVNGEEIGHGLVERAKDGELKIYQRVMADNANKKTGD